MNEVGSASIIIIIILISAPAFGPSIAITLLYKLVGIGDAVIGHCSSPPKRVEQQCQLPK